jgi:glycosyltransferase involved in cell wall biosynthesis
MRIGIFTNNYLPVRGGVTTACEILRRGALALGHQPYLFAPRFPGHADSAPGVFRYPSLPAPTYPDFSLAIPFSPGISRAVADLRIDIFHAQHPFLLGQAARRLARRFGRPLVFTYHTRYEKYAHYVPLPRRIVERAAIRRSMAFASQADLVIAPGEGMRRFLVEQGVESPIVVLPTGVEVDLFAPGDRALARRSLGLPPAGPILLSVGRLDREKSLDLLLTAFAHLATEIPEARLLLVGQGKEAGRLRALGERLGRGDRICFLGGLPREALPGYYRAADLFLFTSQTETQGLVLAEAHACGIPAVAVRAPGADETVRDGETGLLTKPDPRELAEAAVRLLLDPVTREAMGREARELAVREFSAHHQVARLFALYERLLSGEGAGLFG